MRSSTLVPDIHISSCKLLTILIDLKRTDININKFFNNEIQLAKNLEQSDFGKAGIVSVSKNYNKKLLILKVKESTNTTLSKLLNVSQIGGWRVTCRLPQAQQMIYGVIGPVGSETADDEIELYLKDRYSNVNGAKRLIKGNKVKSPTLCIQIAFTSTELLEYVCIGYQRYRGRLFVDKPWQCYNCQGFGHNASDCRYKTKCVICFGPHRASECRAKNLANEELSSLKCSNCRGDHAANYGGCPFMKSARMLKKVIL